MEAQSQGESLQNIATVVERTSLSRAFIWDLVGKGAFPKPVRLSSNRVAWPASTVSAWIEAKIANAA